MQTTFTLSTTHPAIAPFFARCEQELAGLRPAHAQTFLLGQISAWEKREEAFHVWASLGAASPHPFGNKLDAFDVANILLNLRARQASLGDAK